VRWIPSVASLRRFRRLVTTQGPSRFFEAWCEQADRLVELAQEDLARGTPLECRREIWPGGDLITSRRNACKIGHSSRGKKRMHECSNVFAKYIRSRDPELRASGDSLSGKSLAGLFVRAVRSDGSPAPCLAFFNGLGQHQGDDLRSGIGHELAQRGISTLMVDQPGVGEALAAQGLARHRRSGKMGRRLRGHTRESARRRQPISRNLRLVLGRLLRAARGSVREAL